MKKNLYLRGLVAFVLMIGAENAFAYVSANCTYVLNSATGECSITDSGGGPGIIKGHKDANGYCKLDGGNTHYLMGGNGCKAAAAVE